MRVKVKKAFKHLNTGRIWLIGEMFEGDEATVGELASMGFLDYETGRKADYGAMTVRELAAYCAEKGIALKGKPKKAEMIAAIRAAEAGEL